MLADLLSGGLVGALGRLGQAGLDFYQAREERKAEAEKQVREFDQAIKLGEMNLNKERLLAKAGIITSSSAAYGKTLSALHEAEAKLGASYPWVNAIRALVRPFVLTMALIALVVFAALGIENDLSSMVGQIAMMVVTYYFLDRSIFKRKL